MSVKWLQILQIQKIPIPPPSPPAGRSSKPKIILLSMHWNFKRRGGLKSRNLPMGRNNYGYFLQHNMEWPNIKFLTKEWKGFPVVEKMVYRTYKIIHTLLYIQQKLNFWNLGENEVGFKHRWIYIIGWASLAMGCSGGRPLSSP